MGTHKGSLIGLLVWKLRKIARKIARKMASFLLLKAHNK
jgi:hypothetical protein